MIDCMKTFQLINQKVDSDEFQEIKRLCEILPNEEDVLEHQKFVKDNIQEFRGDHLKFHVQWRL